MSYRSREAWFRELARLAPVGMFITDDAGDVVLVNERWCEITGLSEKRCAAHEMAPISPS